MKHFNSWAELQDRYPRACKAIASENQMQYPEAVFVKAVSGWEVPQQVRSESDIDSIVVLFDVGLPDELLVCTNPDPDEEYGGWIDEYQVTSIEDANDYFNLIKY